MAADDFEEQFESLLAVAYRVAFRLLGDRGEAEEVAQEALTAAHLDWRKVGGYAEPFVARVASNQAIGRWRRRRPAGPPTDRAEHPGDDATLTRMALVEALRLLPRRQREVVVLRYVADLDERAVAAALGTSLGTVKQHCHRGLRRLREHLGDQRTLEVDDVRGA